jgi:hypothetical protein
MFVIYYINNIIKNKMKGTQMKTPALTQIYAQKMYYFLLSRLYDVHKKKLDRIREDRKTQLGYDYNRINHIETIKDVKSKSFAHKFNEQS